jgi:predicted transcriptional regulator
MAKQITTFRLDPELMKAVAEAAAALGTTTTSVVEESLRRWLARTQRQTVRVIPANARAIAAQRTARNRPR